MPRGTSGSQMPGPLALGMVEVQAGPWRPPPPHLASAVEKLPVETLRLWGGCSMVVGAAWLWGSGDPRRVCGGGAWGVGLGGSGRDGRSLLGQWVWSSEEVAG